MEKGISSYMNHSCIGDAGNGIRAHECDTELTGLKLCEGMVIKLFKIL